MVTVAIPAFKSKYLKEAIQSVIAQTYKDFEFIILNDASPEDLDTIVSEFHDNRIKYFKNEFNMGKDNLVDVWNKCLNLAKGEYFVLFSDDDVYHKDFLKKMIELANKYPETNVFHCRINEIDDYGKTLTYSPICPEWENTFNFVWHRLKLYRNQYVSDFMCKTEALKKIGGFISFPLGWGSDDATWFTLSKSFGVCFTQQTLFKWRNSSINISKTGNYKKFFEAINLYSIWLKDFTEKLEYDSEEDKYLFEDIKKGIIEWHNSSIRALLLKKLNKNIWGGIKLFFIWVKFRQRNRFTFITFIKTLLSLSKPKKEF